VEPKAWQSKLFRPRRNVEPGQHSGRFLDMLRAHATAIVFIVEKFQTAMLKAVDHNANLYSDNCQLSTGDGAASLFLSRAGPRGKPAAKTAFIAWAGA